MFENRYNNVSFDKEHKVLTRYVVEFSYQMPGDDEFGYESYSDYTILAESKEDAIRGFKEYANNSGRSSAKFYTSYDVRLWTQERDGI